MNVTVILKDFTEQFYTGTESGSVVGLLNLSNSDKFITCKRLSNEKRASMKIGLGQFTDSVELNSLLKKPCQYTFKIESRKGYKLATFEITQ